MPSINPLTQEIATYEKLKPQLLADGHEGKFVLIHKDKLLGIYLTMNEAIEKGYEQVGLDPFYAHQIYEVERVYYFSRNLR
jgi:hypothetical protein